MKAHGSCMCGKVAFSVEEPFAAFQYCHCSRCRKKTGSAHAANAFVPAAQLTWEIAGSRDVFATLQDAPLISVDVDAAFRACQWRSDRQAAWLIAEAARLDTEQGVLGWQGEANEGGGACSDTKGAIRA